MRKLFDILRLVRLHNITAAVLCVGAGYWMAYPRAFPPFLLLAAVALVTAAGNVINDYYDIDIDRINKPRRALPSGGISRRTAFLFYLFLILLLVSVFPGLELFQAGWLAVWVTALHMYSRALKRMPLLGNLTVAVVTGSGFLLGAVSAGDAGAGVIPGVLTFFFVTGREIIKDCEDIEGDERCGARTLPVVAGVARSSRAAAGIFLALVLAFPVPWMTGVYSGAYGWIMVISMLPLLLMSFIFSLLGRRFRMVTMLLKAGMFIGIAAFVAG
ncbi:MAG TPA: geranylgeranylglycerol-phosphate geranylgeranyltransferase [Candidatus Krumholzibacterium sp.]|nr:geranylgeranylglycerol-phosphate geranylgeranyltransferase [Candidatus Krumholzibacterium sp.]